MLIIPIHTFHCSVISLSSQHITVILMHIIFVKSTIIKVTQSSIHCVIMATTIINIIVFMIRVINLFQETVKLQGSFLMHYQTFLQDSDWDFITEEGLGCRTVKHFKSHGLSYLHRTQTFKNTMLLLILNFRAWLNFQSIVCPWWCLKNSSEYHLLHAHTSKIYNTVIQKQT